MRVDELEVVPGENAVVPGGRFGFRGVHDELGLGVLVEAAHRVRLLALLGGRLRLHLRQQQEGRQVRSVGVVALRGAAGLVQQLAHVGLDVSHAEQLEEGLRDGQVHQPVVLDALGQEDAQEVEQLADPLQLLAVLRERRREQTAGALHVETRRLQTAAQVHLRHTDRLMTSQDRSMTSQDGHTQVNFFFTDMSTISVPEILYRS